MALPATDGFAGTNGQTITAYSGNWTLNVGTMQINTSAVAPNTSANQSQANWNADTFANDQYSQITVAAITSGVYIGPAVRLPASGVGGYYIEADSGDGMYLFKNVSGTETQLGSKTAVVATNDVIKLTASGTTITPNKNGSTTGTPGAQTDSSITSGRAGINGYDAGTGSRMDSWEGGNVSSGPSVTDTITLSETVTVRVLSFINKSDTVTLSETVGVTLAHNASVSDTITLSETVATALAHQISVSDTITLSESVSRLLTGNINVTDTITLSESVSRLATNFVSVTDSITLSESVSVAIEAAGDYTISVSDTITLSESVTVRLTSFINKSDTITFSDSAVVLPLLNACVNGVLVASSNARYFENDNGILVLTGAWWWHTIQDGGATYPPAATDWDAYLAYTVVRGGNLIKHSMQESPGPWPDVDPYYYKPLPWARTGPGNANDGLPKFDLTTFDLDYFNRLRQRTIQAGNAGLYVVMQIAQGWMIDQKGLGTGDPWSNHPMQNGNNINSIDGDTDNDGVGEETRDSAFTAVFDIWKALYRRMYDAIGDLDNVLWEISNEDGTYSVTWQHDFIDYIHTYESTRKAHPVGMTWIWPGGDNSADLYSSNADWISYGANDTTPLTNPVVWPDTGASGKVSIWDTDHMGGISYNTTFMWRAFTRGHNPLYMDKYDGSLYGGDIRSDATAEQIRYNLGYIQDYAARIDLANATPQGSLASTGYCLARTTGAPQLLAYQPSAANFTVDLSALSGTYTVEWLKTSDGTVQAGSNISGGGVRTLTPPWSEAVVAFIEQAALTISVSDTITLSESVGRMLQSFVGVSDTITLSEAVTVRVQSYISTSDTVTLSETVALALAHQVTASDTVALSESVAATVVSMPSVADTITFSESVGLAVSVSIAVADTITLSESVTIAVLSSGTLAFAVTDTITLSESVSLNVPVALAVADTITLSEAAALLVQSHISASDTITLSESVALSLPVAISASDSVTLSELVALALPVAISVTDSITLSESVALSIVAAGTIQISVSDTITLSETVTMLLPDPLAISVSDTITLSEIVTVFVVGAVLLDITLSDARVNRASTSDSRVNRVVLSDTSRG